VKWRGLCDRAWWAVFPFAVTLILIPAPACRADDVTRQFWPQFYLVKQAENNKSVTTIFMLNLTTNRATQDLTDGEIGLDVAYKVRPNVLTRIGYHYLRSNLAGEDDVQTEHRINLDLSPVWQLDRFINIYDRNRIEFRDVEGDLSWRYRNRFRLERNFTIRGWVSRLQLLTPYTMAELTYDPKRSDIVRWRFDLGVLTNLTRNTLIEIYVARVSNFNPGGDSRVNGLGTTFTFLLDK
jgi:hypothetical protein